MSVLGLLITGSVALGLIYPAAFFWSVRSGQYDDLEGGAQHILEGDQAGASPLSPRERAPPARRR
jgi:cbb3-type cytochrome oxidase maturation protein